MSKATPVQIYKQGNAPDQTYQPGPENPIPWVDDLWIDITAHVLKQCTSINPYIWVAVGVSGPTVTSVNSLTGAVVLAAGSNVTITPAGNTLTIASAKGPNFQNPITLSGTVDGSNKAFSFPSSPGANYVITVGGEILTPATDYTVSGNDVTMTNAPVLVPVAYQ